MSMIDEIKHAYNTQPAVKRFFQILGVLVVIGIAFAVFG